MHVAGKDIIKSGHTHAENRMVHHGGSYVYYPATAWAERGQTRIELSAEDHPGLDPVQLEQKCVALVRKGCGFKV